MATLCHEKTGQQGYGPNSPPRPAADVDDETWFTYFQSRLALPGLSVILSFGQSVMPMQISVLSKMKRYGPCLLFASLVGPAVLLGLGFVLSWVFRSPMPVAVSGWFAAIVLIWAWGLFLVALWYSPGGVFHSDTIRELPSGTKWFFRFMRYAAVLPMFLLFLSPVLFVWLFQDLIR